MVYQRGYAVHACFKPYRQPEPGAGSKGQGGRTLFCHHQQRHVRVPVSGNSAVRRGHVQCALQHSGQRHGHLSVEEERNQRRRGQIPYHDA